MELRPDQSAIALQQGDPAPTRQPSANPRRGVLATLLNFEFTPEPAKLADANWPPRAVAMRIVDELVWSCRTPRRPTGREKGDGLPLATRADRLWKKNIY